MALNKISNDLSKPEKTEFSTNSIKSTIHDGFGTVKTDAITKKNQKKLHSQCEAFQVKLGLRETDVVKRSINNNYQCLMDKKQLENKLLEMNSYIRLQNLAKLKDSNSVSPDIYYLGPLLQAYGSSLNTKMIPTETGVYLEHFSQGALGLLHIVNKIAKFVSPKYLEGFSNFPVIPLASDKKSTLLFDLDETLAHCSLSNKHSEVSENCGVVVSIRPHAYEVLKDLKQYFEIGLFTSSNKSYADTVVSHFDPHDELFDFRLYKDCCLDIGDSISIKDIRVLRGREIKNIFLVDNNLYCYGLQLTQGIPIVPFMGDASDTELLKLQCYLKILAKSVEPSIFNTKYFGHDILLQQISDSLNNLPNLMLERILEVALGMNKQLRNST